LRLVAASETNDNDPPVENVFYSGDHTATANSYRHLVLEKFEFTRCFETDWESNTEEIGFCGFRRDVLPNWNLDIPWTLTNRTRYLPSILQSGALLLQPEISTFSHEVGDRYQISERGRKYDTFKLLNRAFELGVKIDKTLLHMLSHEPEFLPYVTDMVETFVDDLRDWDDDAEFLLRAFTDPDASGRETLQFVIHYSDNVHWDEMIRKWDEVADELDSIIPDKECRLRVGITFQSFL